jgi:hypothetical protein
MQHRLIVEGDETEILSALQKFKVMEVNATQGRVWRRSGGGWPNRVESWEHVKIISIPRLPTVHPYATRWKIRKVLESLGLGWEGTYGELGDALAKAFPERVASTARSYRRHLINRGCIAVRGRWGSLREGWS